ncbi:MAG: tetratricopeptide repeat protein [Spirochaetales bacterium]|nr:tetratricopeptide repeat protein [Spirochaetales bacterium]
MKIRIGDINTFFPSYYFLKWLSNQAKKLSLALFFLFGIISLWAIDYQKEGEDALSQNKNDQARTFLEAALAQGPATERLYLDLGLVYQKLGMKQLAVFTLQTGAQLGGNLSYLLWYNLGLVDFSLRQWTSADAAYSKSLESNPSFPEAYLNRANVRLEMKNWPGALSDFQTYQKLAPSNPQKQTIDQVIALLTQAQIDQEAQILAEKTRKKEKEAEDAAAKVKAEAEAEAEKKKQAEALAAAEAAAAAEKKKQDAILEKIRNSLKNVSGDTKALGTGPAGVRSDEGDFSLSQ